MLEQYKQNLSLVFAAATAEEKAAGAVWYNKASELALCVAAEYDLTVEVVAGVIAALSPQVSWEQQVKSTGTFVAWVQDHLKWGGEQLFHAKDVAAAPHAGTYANKVKAANILLTGNVTRFLKGPKVEVFYQNMLGEEANCTLDSWAIRAVTLNPLADKGQARNKAGQAMRLAYQELAKDVGLTTAQFQAVVWLAFRGRHAQIIGGVQ